MGNFIGNYLQKKKTKKKLHIFKYCSFIQRREMANSSILVLAITVILCLSQEALLVASSEQFSEIIYEKSNKITKVGENWDTRGYMRNRRESEHMIAKRQTGHDLPDSSLQDYIVDYHNRLRRQEGASNMQHMVSAYVLISQN